MGGTQKPRSGKMEGLFFYLDVVECKCKLHTSHAWLNLPGSYILNNASLLGREAKQNGSRLVRWCSYSDLEEHSRGRGDWWRFASTDERAYWETAISAFAGFSSWDPPPSPGPTSAPNVLIIMIGMPNFAVQGDSVKLVSSSFFLPCLARSSTSLLSQGSLIGWDWQAADQRRE